MGLEIGQVVGDYEIVGIIGAGGMGSVYKVRNLISDRVDAMKILLPDLRGSGVLAERFQHEIKVLASLAHPNIAGLLTALRVDNQLVMIMEFVAGTNLDERLGAGPVPLDEAISWISQVLQALSYAHARGVIHRDIKPANIAITPSGVVKLLDFGLARGRADQRLTRAGMVLGSLFYMSPEQVSGQAADERSDIYSTGVTLYRVVAGRRPIDGESEFAVMRAHVEHIPAPPHHWNPSVPRELSDVIMRALAKQPADRFQTAEQFQQALHPFRPFSAGRTLATAPIAAPRQAARGEATPIPSSGVFHAAALNTLQKILAQSVGPIAGALVRKYSKVAATLPELCQALAGQISSEADRKVFLRGCAKELGPGAVETTGTVEPMTATMVQSAKPVSWDPSVLEKCRKQLAAHVGPLAKVMVDRAAKKARNVEELYAMVSAEIPSPADRERFLGSLG